jgi:hypothetical protein
VEADRRTIGQQQAFNARHYWKSEVSGHVSARNRTVQGIFLAARLPQPSVLPHRHCHTLTRLAAN